MPSFPLLSRAKAYYRRLPAARAFLQRHGLRATLIRLFDEFVRPTPHDSIGAANDWLGNAQDGRPASPASSGALGRPVVAIIGALDLPQCRKYRVVQKIEQLGVHGCQAAVSNYFDVPRSFDVMQLASSVIFYRVPDGEHLQGYLAEARRLGLPVAYDIDDPVFCRTIYKDNANLHTLAPAERAHLLRDSRRYLAAMKQCDAAILSTPGLVEVARPYMNGNPVYLWRNAIDDESQSISVDVAATAPARTGGLRIGYMSGSRAHDLDFEHIAGALAQTLRRYSHVELLIAGHAAIPEALKEFDARIVWRPFSSYAGYFRTLLDADIIVIPLLADNFNACKSAIRFLEAAMVAKPCVISTVGDFLNVVRHGETGYLAETESDWVANLSDLIEFEERRRSIGTAAREDVLARQSANAVSTTLDPTLLQMIKGQPRV